ncbi:MAG: ArnT family glycosyltransferase [Polyangiaceae bacterium]
MTDRLDRPGVGVPWAPLLSTAITLRVAVAFALLGAMPMVSDARDYFDFASRLATGHLGGPFYFPPGESLSLAAMFAAFGSTLLVARLLTIATSVGTVVITTLIARELADERAARCAGWTAALYPPSVMLCGQTYAQHLAALCLGVIALFGLRAARDPRPHLFAWTGLAAGLGILTRPSMTSVVPVLAVAWGFALYRGSGGARRAAGCGAAISACVVLACVVPACTHNGLAGAGWTVSTNNERNLFLGNNPYTPDYKTSHLGQRSLSELDPATRGYLESFYARPNARAAMEHEAIGYMARHPERTALRTLNRATSFWGFDYLASREIQKWRGMGARAALPLLALEGGSFMAVAALALAALFALRGAGDPEWRAWLVALALAYELPYTLAFSGGTYHFPVMPLIIPLASLAMAHPAETWRRARQSRVTWAALATFALVQAEYAYFALVMVG